MSDIQKIQHRKEQLSAKQTSLVNFLDQIKAELIELETAERVLKRLNSEIGSDKPTAGEVKPGDEINDRLIVKPSMPLSVRAMIKASLASAREKQGLKGLKPKDIVDFIRKNHRPDIPMNQIYTNLSRMTNDLGELVKDESLGIYMMSQSNEASDGDTE